MLTFVWTVMIGIAAMWGSWDWRVAATGWIVTIITDAFLLFLASATYHGEP